MDISPTILTVCGITCACGGVFLGAGILLFRVFGQSVLLSALAVLGPLWNLIAGQKNNPEERVSKILREREKRKHTQPDNTAFNAQAQAPNLDFDAQVAQALQQKQVGDSNFTAQSGAPTELTGKSPSVNNAPQSQFGKSRFGVRFNDNDPGRVLRDKRHERNSGPSTFPDASYADLSEEAGVDTNPPPGLGDIPTGRSLRDRRRDGNRRPPGDSNRRDDEILGGIFDEDGDSFMD